MIPNSDQAASADSDCKFVTANGLKLAYDEFGEADRPVVLLIMGLGTQMIAWPEPFCQGLADHGYRVIRFDNRDIGLSEKIRTRARMSIPRLLIRKKLGWPISTPYCLTDMAKDTIGILDSLDIESAHIVGASMGGMIAQIMAAEYQKRCRSLTSIMSTTGNPSLPTADWRVSKVMMMRPRGKDEASLVAHGMKIWRTISSPAYPPTDDELRSKVTRAVRRSYYPRGYMNQLAAIIKNGDRRPILGNVTAPTLCIHGKADRLVPVEGGMDTAKHIAGAKLHLIDGMGHDFPNELLPKFVQSISEHLAAS